MSNTHPAAGLSILLWSQPMSSAELVPQDMKNMPSER